MSFFKQLRWAKPLVGGSAGFCFFLAVGWSEPFLDSSAPESLSEVFTAYIHQGGRDLANMISLRDFPKFGLFTS